MTDIKDYRKRELPVFIVVQLILIVFFQNINELIVLETTWEEIASRLLTSTAGCSFIGVFAFVLDSVVSSEMKSKLVFMLTRIPGETVFTRIYNDCIDKRFTVDSVRSRYQEIYENMPIEDEKKYLYENEQWYKIYAKNQDVSMISTSQRDYLLCRDMYIVLLTILLIYLAVAIFSSKIIVSWVFVIVSLIEIVALNIGTRQRADRFVLNVISYDLSHNIQNYDNN